MTCGMPPALVPVACPISAQTGSNGLPKHHMTSLLPSHDGLCSTLTHHMDNVNWTVHLREEQGCSTSETKPRGSDPPLGNRYNSMERPTWLAMVMAYSREN